MKRSALYKIKSEGKIAGVCAGLAEYFGIETWLVRIIVITSFLLLAPPFIVVGYIALWFILDDKSSVQSNKKTQALNATSNATSPYANASQVQGNAAQYNAGTSQYTESEEAVSVKSKVWQAGTPPRQALLDIKHRYTSVEKKLQRIESYVTSKEFELNREINRL